MSLIISASMAGNLFMEILNQEISTVCQESGLVYNDIVDEINSLPNQDAIKEYLLKKMPIPIKLYD